jgi:acetyltransferase-like isoleucine patch superfamily enzyme
MKIKSLQDARKSQFRRYRDLCYGDTSFGHVLWTEFLVAAIGSMPGAAGVFLRSKLYRGLFASAGAKLLIGRNVTFRHLKKIHLGNNVIIDDNCVIDAKGTSNQGITIEDGVYVGRNTIVYCKNGDILLKEGANISSNCTVFSSNHLTLGAGTMVGAYCYFLSGGEYDYRDATPFAEQSGMETKGELTIGNNCWLGARVTVLDAASIGDHSVIGAGAVVAEPVPADSLAVGVPARVVKSL